jgi:Ca2+-binding EF-hand superfamily protein
MNLKIISITSSLLISAVMANHNAKSFGDGTLPEFLAKYDVNEDGSIDEEERQAIKEERQAARAGRRAKIDIDGDGKISLDQRELLRKRIIAKRAEKFTEIAGDDGVLSLTEMTDLKAFQNMPEERLTSLFARLDADNSGEVNLAEFNMRLRDHSSPAKPDSNN